MYIKILSTLLRTNILYFQEENMEKRKLVGSVSVIENGRKIIGNWKFQYDYVFVDCNDSEFFGSFSIESSYYSAENDALWCLKEIINSKEHKY